jgi:Rrf2 family protein
MNAESREVALGPTWFVVAVQALMVLARSEEACSSQIIAGNLQAHAVFMRRVLAQLARAHLVEAREGREGGYRLGRPADTISLAEVYRALTVESPIPVVPAVSKEACAGMFERRSALREIMCEAEEAVLATLQRHTVGELARRADAMRSTP